VTIRRFPILFTGANKAMALLGITQGSSYVEVDVAEVRVRMSWAFRATIPREHITAVAPYDGKVWGWGAHGWSGRWLVNGSARNLVELAIDPPARGSVAGFPIRHLRQLRVAVVDRDGLLAELSPPVHPPG
jgi:hypothetical protein